MISAPVPVPTSALRPNHARYDNEGTLTSYWDGYYQNEQLPEYTTTYTYSLDAMERPTGLTEQDQPSGNTKTWVQSAAYGPSNELHSLQFATSSGAFYTEARTYNNLLQLTNIAASASGLQGMNLTYTYQSGHNNGQATGVNDGISGEQIAYQYDQLGRLIQAETTQNHSQYPNAPWWGQAYTYDGFGTLLTKMPVGPGNSTAMSLAVDPNTNHYMPSSSYGYDANGNVTTLPQSSGPLTLGYDVENRIALNMGVDGYDMENEPLGVTGSGSTPVYDLSGRRLRHERIYYGPGQGDWYSTSYSITDRNVYFGGRMIQSNSKTVLVDRTGSVRANEAGETFEYLPYGEEMRAGTAQDREKFATYTRSSATGLDYAVNRWYDSVHGSFVTPDVHGASMDLTQPLSMNRYAYVRGDPVNNSDPSGLDSASNVGDCTDSSGNIGWLWWTDTNDSQYCAADTDPADSSLYDISICGSGTIVNGFLSVTDLIACEGPGSATPGAAEGPGPAPYQTAPTCSIELWERPVPARWSPANHTYIEVIDSANPDGLLFEGGPSGAFIWSGLVSHTDPVGRGLGSNKPNNPVASDPTLPSNHEIGAPDVSAYACNQIDGIKSAVAAYDGGTPAPYFFLGFPFYNSNSYTYTLLTGAGISFGAPTGWAPGWGRLVPGL